MSEHTHDTAPMRRDEWERIAATPEFRALLRRKRRFILPATVFFIVYYFALPVLVGYFPELMTRKIVGRFEYRVFVRVVAVRDGMGARVVVCACG